MSNTSDQLNQMIQKSQYSKPTTNGDEFWYSYPNQRILAFNMAHDLILAGEDIDVAIEISKNFVDAFYDQAVKPHAWSRD